VIIVKKSLVSDKGTILLLDYGRNPDHCLCLFLLSLSLLYLPNLTLNIASSSELYQKLDFGLSLKQ